MSYYAALQTLSLNEVQPAKPTTASDANGMPEAEPTTATEANGMPEAEPAHEM